MAPQTSPHPLHTRHSRTKSPNKKSLGTAHPLVVAHTTHLPTHNCSSVSYAGHAALIKLRRRTSTSKPLSKLYTRLLASTAIAELVATHWLCIQ